MVSYLSHGWGTLVDWKNDAIDIASDWAANNEYIQYNKERALLHGLPVSTIVSLAATYLFKCGNLSTGLVFGAVHYTMLTSLAEFFYIHKSSEKVSTLMKAGALIALSSFTTQAFLQTVCKTTLTSQHVVILTVASFAGQIARDFIISRYSDTE